MANYLRGVGGAGGSGGQDGVQDGPEVRGRGQAGVLGDLEGWGPVDGDHK